MINLKEFVSEKLQITDKPADVRNNRFRPDDEWTKECYDALVNEFGHSYNIEQKESGSIYFYKKGSKPSIKNLICAVHGSDYIDFGANDRLEDTLGKEILDVLKEI